MALFGSPVDLPGPVLWVLLLLFCGTAILAGSAAFLAQLNWTLRLGRAAIRNYRALRDELRAGARNGPAAPVVSLSDRRTGGDRRTRVVPVAVERRSGIDRRQARGDGTLLATA